MLAPRGVVSRRPAVTAAVVALTGTGLGVLTAYGQSWLPQEIASLANSSGSWAMVAFALALLATTPLVAAAYGCTALVTLLAGYVVGADVRGYSSSPELMLFWGLAAVLAGPLLGLSAYWVRSGHRWLAAVGAGGISGVLIGEGIYGLAYIADTTYPPYWWGSIVGGLVLLTVIAALRLRRPQAIALSAVIAALVAAALVGVQSQGLITLL